MAENVRREIDELRIELEKKNTEYAVKGGDIVETTSWFNGTTSRVRKWVTVGKSPAILLEMAPGAIPGWYCLGQLLSDIQIQGEMEQSYRNSRFHTQKVNFYKDFLKKYPDSGSEIQKFVWVCQSRK